MEDIASIFLRRRINPAIIHFQFFQYLAQSRSNFLFFIVAFIMIYFSYSFWFIEIVGVLRRICSTLNLIIFSFYLSKTSIISVFYTNLAMFLHSMRIVLLCIFHNCKLIFSLIYEFKNYFNKYSVPTLYLQNSKCVV